MKKLVIVGLLALAACNQPTQSEQAEQEAAQQAYDHKASMAASQALQMNTLACIDGSEVWINYQSKVITPHFVSVGGASYVKPCSKNHATTK